MIIKDFLPTWFFFLHHIYAVHDTQFDILCGFFFSTYIFGETKGNFGISVEFFLPFLAL